MAAIEYRLSALEMPVHKLLTALVCFISTLPGPVFAQATAPQSPAAVQRAVEDFLRIQTSSLNGHTTVSAGPVDPKLSVPSCAALQVFTPPGGKLWGTSSVGVRCAAPTAWTIYVPVTVRVQGPYLAAARPIPAGQVLTQADVALMHGDLTQLPASVTSDAQQVVGKSLNMPLSPGQPLRIDGLRVLPAIVQGQNVRVVSQGAGFRVSAEGKAIANAVVGQVAQVRTATGSTVSGIARADGTVEVSF